MEIDINGLKYRQKEQNNQQTTRQSRMSVMLMGMAMMFSGQGSVGTSKRQRETPKVNIVEEFKLIQEGNISAAFSLGGTSIGIALPIVSLLSHAVNILDVFIWVGLAVLIQLLAWVVINKFIFKSLSADIIADKKSVGLSVGFLSLCVGLINYASLTY